MEGTTPLPYERFLRLCSKAERWNLTCGGFWDQEANMPVLAVKFWTMPARDKSRVNVAWAEFSAETGELLRRSHGRKAPTDLSLGVATEIVAMMVQLGFAEIARKALDRRRLMDVVDEPARLAEGGTLTVGRIRAELAPDVWEAAARALYERYVASLEGTKGIDV